MLKTEMMKRIFLLLGIARALVLEDDLSVTWEVQDEIFRIHVHIDAGKLVIILFFVKMKQRKHGISVWNRNKQARRWNLKRIGASLVHKRRF